VGLDLVGFVIAEHRQQFVIFRSDALEVTYQTAPDAFTHCNRPIKNEDKNQVFFFSDKNNSGIVLISIETHK
jgi:hypothetical protein